MEILLVEDDLEDAGLTIETLREGQVPCRVSLVRDGEEAWPSCGGRPISPACLGPT